MMQRVIQENNYIKWEKSEIESISLEIENKKLLILTTNNTEITLSKEMLEVILPHINRFYRTGRLT